MARGDDVTHSPHPPSLDGVPFLLRDRTLGRTTDVSEVFPERRLDDASQFNWTDLRSLNAGRWFLKVALAVCANRRRGVGNARAL